MGVAALGTRVDIDLGALADDAVVAIEDAWRDALSACGSAVGPVRPRLRDGVASMLSSLSQTVTLAAIEARKGELWMLHAAGVALPDGRVAVFVAPSGGGKTTLSARLGAEYAYVSDETIGIDDDGRVWPYRKPLSIIEEASAPKAQRAPSDLGLLPLPDVPLQVAAIVLLDRRREVIEEPTLESVDLGEALPELVTQSSFLTKMPAPLRTIARTIDRVGGVLRATYSDVDSLVPLLPLIVEHREEVPLAATDPRPAGGVALPAREPSYHRAATLDAITLADPDRIAVLQVGDEGDGKLRVLAGIAPTLWRASSGASLDGLVAAAVAEHGTPEEADAAALVGAAADELTQAGVLELRPANWTIRTDVAWTGEGARFVVVPLSCPGTGLLVMQGPAGLVWAALAEGAADVETVSARVARMADLTPEDVREDISAFLLELERSALVTRC